MQSILWSRMVLMALVLLVPATKGLPGQVVNGQKGARQLELLFFQPGGEKLSRPISLVVRIQTGQGGVGAVSAGGSRISVKDGRHILNLTTGGESRVTLAIEGDARRYGDTIAVFRVGEDVTAYPVFLSPVVDETSGGMGRRWQNLPGRWRLRRASRGRSTSWGSSFTRMAASRRPWRHSPRR